MNTEVKRSIIKESNARDGRVYILPLVSDKMLPKKSLILDKEMRESTEFGKYTTKSKFFDKYRYLHILQYMIGERDAVCVEGQAKNNPKYMVHTENLMQAYIGKDWVCNYITNGVNDSDQRIIKLIDNHGIDKVIGSIENVAGALPESNASNKQRMMALIQVHIRGTEHNAMKMLQQITYDNVEELTQIRDLHKLINTDADGSMYFEFIVGQLIDEVMSEFTPAQCTQFFKGIDESGNVFSNFGFSEAACESLNNFRYRSKNGYITEVIHRIQDTYTEDIAQEQYKEYATDAYLEDYKAAKRIHAYKSEVANDSDVVILSSYYEAINDGRYLHIYGEKPSKDEVKQMIQDVIASDENYRGFVSWRLCWDDFAEYETFKEKSFNEFVEQVFSEFEDTEKPLRLTIQQKDQVLLGGMSVYDTKNSNILGVSVWIAPAMGHVGLAKEALWGLASGLKNTNFDFIELRINKNNWEMLQVAKSIGAKETSTDGVYLVSIKNLCEKTFEDLRKTVEI